MRKTNRYILGFVYLFLLLFLGLVGYLCYFNWKVGPTIVNSPYNGRLDRLNENCFRGSILSADGETIAYTKLTDSGKEVRTYPFGNVFAHVVGYTTVGQAGLESSESYYLVNSHESLWTRLVKEIKNGKADGDTVVTTLNTDIQKIVSDAMDGYQGACVVMNPKTGDILAMVSKPDYNPNTIEKNYEKLVADETKASLLNRATKGLYCPGSTFKIVTALAYLEQNGSDWKDYEYYCTGSIKVNGQTIKCSHGTAHGKVDLEAALAKSCNCAFINLGIKLNKKQYRKTAKNLMFNQKLDLAFATSKSKFALTSKSGVNTLAQTAFGQGDTLVTPLLNAMIVSAVANDGVMMKPKLVSAIQDASGSVVETFADESLGSVMSSKNASILSDMMVSVVNNGTATVLKSSQYQAAAKTGSAQTKDDKETDAWLVAYAPAKDPQIVVSIVLEEGGAGSTAAGPIVKKIFDNYIK